MVQCLPPQFESCQSCCGFYTACGAGAGLREAGLLRGVLLRVRDDVLGLLHLRGRRGLHRRVQDDGRSHVSCLLCICFLQYELAESATKNLKQLNR